MVEKNLNPVVPFKIEEANSAIYFIELELLKK